MGLNMYGCITTTQVGEVDFALPYETEDIAYWCKHPNLHGWMENLYREKGGAGTFNGTTVRLDAADLDALERALSDNSLPETKGFSFDEDCPDDSDLGHAFIADAREELAAGYTVFYYSWWF